MAETSFLPKKAQIPCCSKSEQFHQKLQPIITVQGVICFTEFSIEYANSNLTIKWGRGQHFNIESLIDKNLLLLDPLSPPKVKDFLWSFMLFDVL